MSIAEDVYNELKLLAGGRVYPDVNLSGAAYPLIIYQQVGGRAYAYVEQKLPTHRHARVQINVWSKNRIEADTIALQIEQAIIEGGLIAEVYSAPTALYNEALELHGTRQDFGIFYIP